MPETGEITLFTKPDFDGQKLVIHALIEDTVQIITLTNTIRIRSMKIDARLYVQFFSNESELRWFMYDKWRYSGDYPSTSAHFDLYYKYGGTGLIRVTLKSSSIIPKIFPSLKNFVLKNIYTDSDSMTSYNLNPENTNTSTYDLGTSYNLNPDTSFSDLSTSYNLKPDNTGTSYDLSTSINLNSDSHDLSISYNYDTDNTEIENAIIDLLNNVKDHNQLNLSDTLNSESINVDDIQENEKIINKNENEKKKENDQENENNHLFLFYTITILLGIIVVIVVYLYSV